MLNKAIIARIAAVKRRLKAGGLLVEVGWLRRTGPRDVRGRQDISTTMIDALIVQGHGLERDRFTTERADDTVLVIFDPVAISDVDFFRWGGTPATTLGDGTPVEAIPGKARSIKKIDGLVADESGTKYLTEVTVIR